MRVEVPVPQPSPQPQPNPLGLFWCLSVWLFSPLPFCFVFLFAMPPIPAHARSQQCLPPRPGGGTGPREPRGHRPPGMSAGPPLTAGVFLEPQKKRERVGGGGGGAMASNPLLRGVLAKGAPTSATPIPLFPHLGENGQWRWCTE